MADEQEEEEFQLSESQINGKTNKLKTYFYQFIYLTIDLKIFEWLSKLMTKKTRVKYHQIGSAQS